MPTPHLVDLQAFPFSQNDLIQKPTGLRIDPAIALDIAVVTCAPPFLHTIQDIEHECGWLAAQIKNQPGAKIVHTAADLAHDGLRVLFGLQHPPTEMPLDHHIYWCSWMKQLGIHFSSLAYDTSNRYGGGFAFPHTPLTASGKMYLTAMDRAKMCLDLSHVGEDTAREALQYIKEQRFENLRVVATHSGCSLVHNHLRNLPDDVLSGIADRGGVIGIPTATFLLHESDNTLAPFIRHIDHAIDVAGVSAVAIGTDGMYRQIPQEEEDRLHAMLSKKIDPNGWFKARVPNQPPELNTPKRMEVLRGILEKNIVPSECVDRILGENAYRFLVDFLK